MREKYESLALADLKEIARARGIKGTSTMKKADLVDAMLREDEKDKAEGKEVVVKSIVPKRPDKTERVERAEKAEGAASGGEEERFPAELDSGIVAHGILEVMSDGFGFIRCENYLPGENDVYVAPSQIRRFGLKTGDILEGNTRVKTQSEKFSALLYVRSINGYTPDMARSEERRVGKECRL